MRLKTIRPVLFTQCCFTNTGDFQAASVALGPAAEGIINNVFGLDAKHPAKAQDSVFLQHNSSLQ